MPDLDPRKAKLFESVGYAPHSAEQMAYHLSDARFRVACCGRRFGKSTMAAMDVANQLTKPNTLGWIVGPTYDLGEKEFRVLWDTFIVKMGFGRDKRVKKAYNKRSGEMYIEMPWKSRVEVRSATHPDYLVGEKLHWCIMSEAAKHNIETWQRFIRPSLADYRGSADFPTTPEGYNWLYDIWRLGFDDGFPQWASWQFPSWANPVVYPLGRQDPEILEIERTTTPEWFAQEIAADFSSFVGKIYEEFTEATHVRTHTFRPEWKNYIAFDWGYVNPLAAIEFQVSPSDDIYIWREHYKSYMRVEEHCDLLRNREQPEGYHLDLAFGDAADPEATETVSQKLVGCISMPEAKENWREGIDLVKSFMKPRPNGLLDEFETPMMVPKLFVDPSCTNFIREAINYKAPDKVKSNLRESAKNSAAEKQDDHLLDAIRYGLVHIYKLGAIYSLADVMMMNQAAAPVGERLADRFDEGRLTMLMEEF